METASEGLDTTGLLSTGDLIPSWLVDAEFSPSGCLWIFTFCTVHMLFHLPSFYFLLKHGGVTFVFFVLSFERIADYPTRIGERYHIHTYFYVEKGVVRFV